MKPSERIKEIVYATTGGGIGSADITLWAIVKYLDEEYEKPNTAKEGICFTCHEKLDDPENHILCKKCRI
jgi:hypothetical protein